MPDGPLKADTGDLKAARGQPPGQRIQGLLDVPGRQLPALDATQNRGQASWRSTTSR